MPASPWSETGFVGGGLKHRQLRAVRCSRSVPLGYAQCDVLRPEAYCRALPVAAEASPSLSKEERKARARELQLQALPLECR